MKRSPLHDLPLDREISDAVANLKLEVRRAIEGFQGGTHSSLHRSPSIEFSEHRRYSPGDDLRTVDWKAVARTDRAFIKTHEQEARLSCLLLMDCSGSMAYRGTRAAHSKLEFARILLGAIGYVLLRQGDAVGLMTFSDQRHVFLPPANNPGQLYTLLHHLTRASDPKCVKTDYIPVLREAAGRMGQRGLILLASDFFGAEQEAESLLSGMALRQHDVVLFQILSPDEMDLPFEGVVRFRGLEAEGDLLLEPQRIRKEYRDELNRRQQRWERTAANAGMELIRVITSDAPATTLTRFSLHRNRHRVRR
jgi:uncharacterized protein (DUF58 family)